MQFCWNSLVKKTELVKFYQKSSQVKFCPFDISPCILHEMQLWFLLSKERWDFILNAFIQRLSKLMSLSQKTPKLKLHQSWDFLRCRCIWIVFYESLLEAAAAVMFSAQQILQRWKSSSRNTLQSPKQYFMPPTILYSLLLFPEAHPCLSIFCMQTEGEIAWQLVSKEFLVFTKYKKKR